MDREASLFPALSPVQNVSEAVDSSVFPASPVPAHIPRNEADVHHYGPPGTGRSPLLPALLADLLKQMQ